MAQQHITDKWLRHWGFATVLVAFIAYLAHALLGPLNQDEGWYLYAAQQVAEGALPHRDFFFTQGLIMPCVYAAFEWLWAPMGVLGGRLFTALLSLGALLLGSRTLARVCEDRDQRRCAALVLWSLLGLNLWYTYFTTIPKAYALCSLGIALALGLLTKGPNERFPAWRVFTAGVILALLANVRLSMGILLPTVGIWLVVQRAWAGQRAWLWFGLGGLLGLGLTFGPELLFWREGFLAAQHFHAARESMGLLGKLGCIARWIRFNPLTIGCLLLLLLWRPKPTTLVSPLGRLWGLCALVLFLVHLAAPVPYDDYAIPAFLPLAMALALAFATRPWGTLLPSVTKGLVLLAGLITVVGAPMAQDWVVVRQDRFWVELKSEPDLFRLRRAAHELRSAAQRLGTDVVWTQDTYLAVEAGLKVPLGLEMGPFSPQTPLTELPPLAAWSGYTFALDFPSMGRAQDRAQRLAELQKIYTKPLLILPNFGQGATTLTLAERLSP